MLPYTVFLGIKLSVVRHKSLKSHKAIIHQVLVPVVSQVTLLIAPRSWLIAQGHQQRLIPE